MWRSKSTRRIVVKPYDTRWRAHDRRSSAPSDQLAADDDARLCGHAFGRGARHTVTRAIPQHVARLES